IEAGRKGGTAFRPGKPCAPGSFYPRRNSARNGAPIIGLGFGADFLAPTNKGNDMSPMKVMPLLLTGITPFVMVSGAARAAEPQIILAQAQTPQQLEEDKKKKLQQQQQQHGQGQPQQQQPHAQQPQQPQPRNVQGAQPPQQQNAQEQQQKV